MLRVRQVGTLSPGAEKPAEHAPRACIHMCILTCMACIQVGTLPPGAEKPAEVLRAGEVGYMHGAIKSVNDAKVGDTIINVRDGRPVEPLAGYCEPVPVVYCGLFPVDTTQYQLLRESLERLQLNDAALCFEPETSSAMGFGFRCGFLGLLHMEIVQ